SLTARSLLADCSLTARWRSLAFSGALASEALGVLRSGIKEEDPRSGSGGHPRSRTPSVSEPREVYRAKRRPSNQGQARSRSRSRSQSPELAMFHRAYPRVHLQTNLKNSRPSPKLTERASR